MKRWGLLALLLVAAALTATPSRGATFEKVRYADFPYSFTHGGCGFPVDVQGTASGQYITRTGKNKDASAFFAHDNYRATEIHTNPETGDFITLVVKGNFNEVKATRVQNSIFRFTAVDAFNARIYDSDGDLIGREGGSIIASILFDTQGDDVPGGVFIEFLGDRFNGKFFDFCPFLAAD